MLQSRIRDPGSGIRCLFDPWIRNLGSRIGIRNRSKVRIQIRDPDPGWKTRIIFLRAEKPFFLVKILKFFDADPGSNIRDGKNSDPGSGIQDRKNLDPGSGIRDGKNSDPGSKIQDKHPGSAKLEILSPNLLGLKEPNNNRTLCRKGILR
jgi:hypothetical protein